MSRIESPFFRNVEQRASKFKQAPQRLVKPARNVVINATRLLGENFSVTVQARRDRFYEILLGGAGDGRHGLRIYEQYKNDQDKLVDKNGNLIITNHPEEVCVDKLYLLRHVYPSVMRRAARDLKKAKVIKQVPRP